MREAAIAVADGVSARDHALEDAMVHVARVEADERMLRAVTAAMELLNRGCAMLMRDREEAASAALTTALNERKRQYLSEHPELLEEAASMPTAARKVIAQYHAEESVPDWTGPGA